MRSIFDDLEQPMRRGFGPTVGNDPASIARQGGPEVAPLPILERPIAPSQQFARIDAALPDERIGRFVRQSREQNPFTLRQRAELVKPYGYKVSRNDMLDGEGYAKGGMVKGGGTKKSDSIPARISETGEPIRLSRGEYEVPPEAAQRIGIDNLDSLIAKHAEPKDVDDGTFIIPAEVVEKIGRGNLDKMVAQAIDDEPRGFAEGGACRAEMRGFADGGEVDGDELRRNAQAAEQQRAAVQQRLANAPTERQRIERGIASQEPARIPTLGADPTRAAIDNRPRIDDPRLPQRGAANVMQAQGGAGDALRAGVHAQQGIDPARLPQAQPRAAQPNVRSAIEAKLPASDPRLAPQRALTVLPPQPLGGTMYVDGAGNATGGPAQQPQPSRALATLQPQQTGGTMYVDGSGNARSGPQMRPGTPMPAIDVPPPRAGAEATGYRAGQAVNAAGTKVLNATRAVLPAAAIAAEATNSVRDIAEPGMTGIDKLARGAEGVGRAAGAYVGGVGGATLGAPLGPVGSAVGGIAGGLAGYFMPDAVNAAYNRFTGNGNQLASTKAEGLRADAQKTSTQQTSAPAATKPLPGSPTDKLALSVRDATANGIDSFNFDFGPGNRGSVAVPQRQAPAARPVAQPEQPSKLDRATADARANGVTHFEYDLDGKRGTVGQAPAAIDDAYTVWTNSPGSVLAAPGSGVRVRSLDPRLTSGSEGAWTKGDNPQFIHQEYAGNEAAYLDARRARAIDAVNPRAAELRDLTALENTKGANKLNEQREQSRATLGAEGIRSNDRAAQLAHDKTKEAKPVVIGGGQKALYDERGNFIGVVQEPQRAIRQNPQTGLYEDVAPVAHKPPIFNDQKAQDIKNNPKLSPAEKRKQLEALGYK